MLLSDMSNYADALAIVSNKMDQIPSKDSMPGSLYSDLAKIYEKAVQSRRWLYHDYRCHYTIGRRYYSCSAHNTGYITEGRLYLRRDSEVGKVIVDPFRSLSRLKQPSDRQGDKRGPPTGYECAKSKALCRCRQCSNEARKWL